MVKGREEQGGSRGHFLSLNLNNSTFIWYFSIF